MPRATRPKISSTTPLALAAAGAMHGVRDLLQPAPGTVHGNRKLHDRDVFTALLCAFFDPLVRSQRTVEQLSEVPDVQAQLEVDRIAQSTLSDALGRFDTQPLAKLLRLLHRQLGGGGRLDPALDQLVRKLVALDGSYFLMAGDVAWALRQRNADGRVLSRVRLDMQLDVRRWTPERFAVHGRDEGSEARAQAPMLESGVTYLMDRLYVQEYRFIKEILGVGAHFVGRAKQTLCFRVKEQRPLTDKDHEAQIQWDEVGLLGSGKPSKDKNKPTPPAQMLRRVTIWDPASAQQVALLTDLLDLPAWVIGYLYRLRWIIEVFFRWLKVTAAMEHLISHTRNGITVQFYVAMIAVMLIHLQSGLPVSKYSLVGLSFVARGQAQVRDVLPGIMRREREKLLEKQRLARKKAANKTPKMLPG